MFIANCHGPPERTKHVMYDWLGQGFWQVMNYIFNDIISSTEPDHDNIMVSGDLILFNHRPPGMNHLHAKDFTDIIMIAKHAIVKIKYRENQERLPTERFLIATVALDAEKVSRIRAQSS